jgi:3-deoxy-D-manno-octulosonic-acid transferase
MLEPAALGIPVVTGPHLFNFLEISQTLRETDALRVISNADALATTVRTLLLDPLQRTAAGEHGRMLVERNRGGLDRLLTGLRPFLDADG